MRSKCHHNLNIPLGRHRKYHFSNWKRWEKETRSHRVRCGGPHAPPQLHLHPSSRQRPVDFVWGWVLQWPKSKIALWKPVKKLQFRIFRRSYTTTFFSTTSQPTLGLLWKPPRGRPPAVATRWSRLLPTKASCGCLAANSPVPRKRSSTTTEICGFTTWPQNNGKKFRHPTDPAPGAVTGWCTWRKILSYSAAFTIIWGIISTLTTSTVLTQRIISGQNWVPVERHLRRGRRVAWWPWMMGECWFTGGTAKRRSRKIWTRGTCTRMRLSSRQRVSWNVKIVKCDVRHIQILKLLNFRNQSHLLTHPVANRWWFKFFELKNGNFVKSGYKLLKYQLVLTLINSAIFLDSIWN